MNPIPALAIAVLLLGGCALAPESNTSAAESSPSPTTRDISGCPVAVPPRPGFVPPEPYPPEPPGFENVWYGTPELWTFLEPNGAVWSDLPVGKGPHAVGNKTLWFSENFSTADGEDFSGDAEITLTGVNLAGPLPRWLKKAESPRSIATSRISCSLDSDFQSRDAGKSPPRTQGPSSLTYSGSRIDRI